MILDLQSLSLSLQINLMFHYTTAELQIFYDHFNCLLVLFSKNLNPMLLPSLPFHTWSLKSWSRRWEQMTSWDLITRNYSISQYNPESTIPSGAKQNCKHLNLFLTGTKNQNPPWILSTEKTPSEHPFPWKQLSSTAGRTVSIPVPHLIPQPAGQQQQAGGQAVLVGLLPLGKPGMSVWCPFPAPPPIRLVVFLSYLVRCAGIIWEMSERHRIVTGFVQEAEHLQTK